MPKKTMRDAINEALHQAMAADERVFVIGEDVAGGNGSNGKIGCAGGVFGVTTGLYEKFGPLRCIDTPISESAIVGAAAGAALVGMRPVAEIMFADFIGVCMDQLVNQIGKFRYMFGGKTTCPAVVRLIYGAGMSAAAQHSQSVYAMLTAMPGLKVVMPTTPADAKGLLSEALRGDDPVMFFEHKALYGVKGEVPDGDHVQKFGEARMVREGGDVTIVTCGRMVNFSEKAADKLAADGIGIDLIDLRTTSPLDEEAILDSVESTGRLVVVDESPPRVSLAADIIAIACNKAFSSLKAPPEAVTAPHSPIPFARELERAWVPSPQRIEDAVRRVLAYR
jgi:pyruvate dehydrogenase E1 component beta subunit